MQTLSVRIPATFDLTHAPPVDVRWISVLFVAGHNAALAPDAFAHVEVKAKLFAGQ
jgi:hypothetical protein